MNAQITQHVLMIRPSNFRSNEQTSTNNFYQKKEMHPNATLAAQLEFDRVVNKLSAIGVRVHVWQDDSLYDTPDALFPNNWISFHHPHRIAIYPMYAPNRRNERREDPLKLLEKEGFYFKEIMDYSEAENENLYLEGTGVLILDRVHKKAYCSLSERADPSLLEEFCEEFDYMPITFRALQTHQNTRKPIYHTNVMMCIGISFAVICLDCIDNDSERKKMMDSLSNDGKEIITISEDQVQQFAGNMLQLMGHQQTPFLVMSESAYLSLTKQQIKRLKYHTEIVSIPIPTIELLGGGSVRCMIAEIFNTIPS